MIPDIEFHLPSIIRASNGKSIFVSLREKERDDMAKRVLVGLVAARTKGAYARISCNRLPPRETM